VIEWMAPVAHVEPWTGGAITWTHVNGDTVAGTFVELIPGPDALAHERVPSASSKPPA
jgi:hypothetical protein